MRKTRKPKVNVNLIAGLISRGSYGKLLLVIVTAVGVWVYNETQDKSGSNEVQTSQEMENPQNLEGIAKAGDGDSITLSGNGQKYKIRLVYIDAPEFKQKCLDKNNYEYFCGQVSAQYLQKMVDGKSVRCEYEKKDMYNRFLGNCFLGEVNINEELLKNGMVITYSFDGTDPRLQEIENQAKINKIGVWQGAFLEPSKFRKKNKS